MMCLLYNMTIQSHIKITCQNNGRILKRRPEHRQAHHAYDGQAWRYSVSRIRITVKWTDIPTCSIMNRLKLPPCRLQRLRQIVMIVR